ncbi:MAG: hypothetical protein Q4D82_01040 [Neisseria sp.]|nr:hypothetical protein [Neisseria sp.]
MFLKLVARLRNDEMSRSRRKTPIRGVTAAESEKQDKRFANRAFRRKEKMALAEAKSRLIVYGKSVMFGAFIKTVNIIMIRLY